MTPLTTYTQNSTSRETDPSAADEERLPPGGFTLRHGFPQWFQHHQTTTTTAPSEPLGRNAAPLGTDSPAEEVQPLFNPATSYSSSTLSSSATSEQKAPISIIEVFLYLRSAFDDEAVLDSVPLAAACNPGAWRAWRAHRAEHDRCLDTEAVEADHPDINIRETKGNERMGSQQHHNSTSATRSKQPAEWKWDGVWEERARRCIESSIAEPVLYGTANDTKDLVGDVI